MVINLVVINLVVINLVVYLQNAYHYKASLVYCLFPITIYSKNRGGLKVIIDYLLCQCVMQSKGKRKIV